MPTPRLHNDPTSMLDQALTRAVQLATGIDEARPRPGQAALSANIMEAMAGRSQTLGEGPTGVGKSLAYLTPAMLFAAVRGERSVLSTESLALQAQIVEKDAPIVATAVAEITGCRPEVAVLKGWSNYVCASKVVAAVEEVVDTPMPQDATALPIVAKHIEIASRNPQGSQQVDGGDHDMSTLLPLLSWGVEVHSTPELIGDRASVPVRVEPADWSAVSLSPDECPGRSSCPFGEICKPANAKEKAAEADIVVTNHAYLAVQASTNAPIVLGSQKLGTFRHLVLDECHTMPSQVRSAGAKEISAFRVYKLIKAIERAVVMDPRVSAVLDQGRIVADSLDGHLSSIVARGESKGRVQRSPGSDSGVLKVENTETPLEELIDLVKNWTIAVKQVVPSPDSTIDTGLSIKLKRVYSGAESLAADVSAANVHEVGNARWISVAAKRSNGRWAGHSIQISPVDVALAMRTALYTADVLPSPEVLAGESAALGLTPADSEYWAIPEHDWCSGTDPEKPRHPMSVTAVSATLPPGYAYDSGMSVRGISYPSPFDDAYGGSVFFVPSARDEDELAAITSSPYGKRKFDTSKHQRWATKKIVRLASANNGSALVLAATARAGREYAAALREQTDLRVLSQWDGATAGQIVADWRSDTNAVLVGTRSLMTGVDAPGETCNLVIVDRVPRAAGNPVDDARVEILMERQELDRWAADRYVYVSDAVLLLEQAFGRLIRRASDSGMVACLDPRLLKSKPLAYQEPTRKMLLEASARFTNRISSMDAAVEFLRAQSARSSRKAA